MNGSSAEPHAYARALVRSRPSCRACGAAYFERIASRRASTTTHAVTKASSFHQESRTPRTRAPITNMTSRRRNAINAVTSSSSPSAPAPLCAPLRCARLCWTLRERSRRVMLASARVQATDDALDVVLAHATAVVIAQ
jgi:hypothetical protein